MRRVLIIGASADSGFLNNLQMNGRVGLASVLTLAVLALAYALPMCLLSLLHWAAPRRGAMRSQTDLWRKKLTVHYFQTFLSTRGESIFHPIIDWLSEETGEKIKVTDYSYPLAGLFNIDRKKVSALLSSGDYDLIFVHLGGNDVIQTVNRNVIHQNSIFLAKEIRRHAPSAMVVLTSCHNMGFCFSDETHLHKNFLKLPFAPSLSGAKIEDAIGFTKRLREKIPAGSTLRATVEARAVFVDETLREAFAEAGVHVYHLNNYDIYQESYDVWRDKFSLDGFHPNRAGTRFIGLGKIKEFRGWYEDHLTRLITKKMR